MPRDSAGNYNLVSGNPVQSGEVISSSWANNTLNDVAVALSDSLDRNGRGGMLAPFRFSDGTNLLPGAAWVNETSTGFYRFDGGDLRVAVLTQDVMRWQTTGAQIWDGAQWNSILTGGSGGQVPVNAGTADGQTLRWELDNSAWEATSNLVVDDSGNVGIGNPTPEYPVDITTTSLVPFRGTTLGGNPQIRCDIAEGTASARTQALPRLMRFAFTGLTDVQERIFSDIACSVTDTSDATRTSDLSFATSNLGTTSEKMVIESTGLVGIGTLTPDNLLEVSGPTAFTGYLRLSDTDGSGIILSDKATPTDSWTMQRRHAGSGTLNGILQFNTNSAASGSITSVLALTDAGSVGIGNANAPDYSGWTTLAIGDTNSGNIDFFSGGSHRGSLFATSGGLELKSSSGEATTFSIGSIDAMTIDSAGNVGIGTADPATELHVKGSSVDIRTQVTGDTQDGRISFAQTDGTVNGVIRYSHTDNAMRFMNNNEYTERMRIDSAGNVGIATTTPSAKLEVKEEANNIGILLDDSSLSNTSPQIVARGRRSDANVGGQFAGKMGLQGIHTNGAVANSKVLGWLGFGGNHTDASDSNILYGASVAAKSSGAFNSATDMPTDLVFNTGIAGFDGTSSAIGTERMRIDSAGVVTGLFTGTGVTQASSKFEVVTALPAAPDANTIYFVT